MLGSKAIGTIAVMGGTPSVLTEFMWSLVQLVIFSREAMCDVNQHIHVDIVRFSDHAPARNALSERFLGDWILFLDMDHNFEADLLVRMVELANSAEVDVLTALYRLKSPPYSPVIFSRASGTLNPIASWEPADLRLMEIAAAGAGCLWVRRKVFEAIAKTGEGPWDRMPGLSEDHSLFRRLEKLEIKAFCAPRIKANHLRIKGVDDEDAELHGFSVSEPLAAGVGYV